ncbi:hypothetical protein PF005_g29163 [Phytophthora fragariae]|uniref:Uncharacterized protein n=1 Tax=Phytophthora fragariae TaxID=53985 RepID=A0A6A3VTJ3_9STRA|nr:hypothetical protein PF003_g1756 [Phytophthora fragariae]KAE9064380.1 hypothetical protein PF010_g28629 [Phytophthora fragariae]KAE9074735.1 hypothetical protein PF006_g28479 [Phytophthora fragariae]KAE9166545.1 hypothetical protein PF005_g29163 [Phytophthora fragariae]KAE9173130.1 hypothetical protein PF002_g29385 [Phytophthora fragariae]
MRRQQDDTGCDGSVGGGSTRQKILQKFASLERPRRRDDQYAQVARTTGEGRDDIKALMDGQEPPPRVAGLNPLAVSVHVYM